MTEHNDPPRRPTVGVAVLIVEHGRVLLVRRRYGAYAGMWCIPCGHLEWDEDVREAALRELEEETGLRATLDGVYDVHSNWHRPERQTVGIWFRATVVGGDIRAGDDADDVGWFDLTTLPELAFPTDVLVLQRVRNELSEA